MVKPMNDLFGDPAVERNGSRARNEWWDAVCLACYGQPFAVRSMRGVVARASNDLKDMGANEMSIRKVANEWKAANRDDAQRYLTPPTLVKAYLRYREKIETPRATQGMDFEAYENQKKQHLAQLRLHGWPH